MAEIGLLIAQIVGKLATDGTPDQMMQFFEIMKDLFDAGYPDMLGGGSTSIVENIADVDMADVEAAKVDFYDIDVGDDGNASAAQLVMMAAESLATTVNEDALDVDILNELAEVPVIDSDEPTDV